MTKISHFFKYQTGLIGICLFITGCLYNTPALISSSILLIVIQPFLVYKPGKILKEIIGNKVSLFFIVIYVMTLIGGIYTSHKQDYLEIIRIRLPFILLPIGLVYKELYNKRNFFIIFILLNSLTLIIGISSFINYVVHKDAIDLLILESKHVPILMGKHEMHIYYSFILAFCTLETLVLSFEYVKNRGLKIVNYIMFVFNVIFIHTIAAKTGLLAFYCSVFFVLIFWGIMKKKYLLMLINFSLILVFCFISYLGLGPLKNRFINQINDLKTYSRNGDINHRSTSMRIEAWKMTYKVFLSSPIIGVGNGDLIYKIKKGYSDECTILTDENQKGPHNQYLEEMASSGIIGLLLLLGLLLYPLRRIILNKDYLTLSFLIIILVSFCFESILERQLGVSFFALFWLYLNSKYSKLKEPESIE